MVKTAQGSGRKASRRSQFDALSVVYDRFNVELLKCGDPRAADLAQSWIVAKTKHTEWLENPEVKVTRSAIAAGLRQGLRETPLVLQGVPDPVREQLLSVFNRILQDEVPDFFPDERHKLTRIVKRGRIRNEGEYYLVRHRVDEIEGRGVHDHEVAALLGLLDAYEGVR